MLVERQNLIGAPVEQVWARVVTPEGINDELRPWMTMSMPRGAKDLTVDTMPVGTPVGRCWMRLFGVLPFDFDDLTGTLLHLIDSAVRAWIWRISKPLTQSQRAGTSAGQHCDAFHMMRQRK
ncbi:hypothetical protein [Mycolicibacterium moriokaense]|uniref:Uncharacterized protein n=1 Tax=Mycolicibacterium moriokaense TaxID=39691 RepID=A0AAD1M816_9MYCO|nr:hypothetical protein [Mycolicibacterium moriokaense]BBX03049.1 hypothetical protein MMOR_39850 [Mycolicibacterium moriokaense]